LKRISILLLFAIIITITLSFATGLAQRRYDPETVKVTRWLDTTTSPVTYDEYNQTRNFAQSPDIHLVRASTVTTDIMIDIIVNANLYPNIEGVLDTFLLDLQLDGYGFNLYTALETQTPTAIRQLLHDDWVGQDIVGVILIGDLAVPWYEMDEPDDWGGAHVMFPCDLYFMDLDGTWGDSNTNGMYDSHSGALTADIWCGRLKSSNLQYHGATEVGTMRNYFRKNHAYRAGDLRLVDHGLAFIDNDWCTYGWGFDVALSFPQTDSVVDIYETNRANYIDLVRENSDNQYEHVLICSHSSPASHFIYYNESSYQQFYNYEIESYMMQALSYNLFACSNSRYVENDNMGAWYIFETDYGLISLGSTKTGSMLCFDDFYDPLGQGSTYGDAFLIWAQTDIETCAGSSSRAWFYGMCLMGDPTLRLARYQPPLEYCIYVPGDINGDGSVLGGDVTYGVQYFRGLGDSPTDSCWDSMVSRFLYVAADANGSCEFLGSDITYLVNYFRGVHSSIRHCPRFALPE